MGETDRERWDARYRAGGGHGRRAPPRWLDEVDDWLPRTGRALDVAAGAGRVAVWLARRGLDVTAVDVSPVGLSLARELAADEGMRLATEIADLEHDPLPGGPFALVACIDYRQPSLFPEMIARLAPGGVLVAQLATVRNLERHEKPSRRFLAEPGELREAAGELDVVLYDEDWYDDRHVARLVARRGDR